MVESGTHLLLGQTIADRYEIVSLLNAGGMGLVYRARQQALEREVAIKFIHPHLLQSEVSIRRFMAEARALSRMNHPHVVTVFDFGQTSEAEGGHLFLVMELLVGPDLGEVIRLEPFLPIGRVVRIISQTLDALSEAHHLGITHRDVKPENIIIESTRDGRDHVKVIDFGIATIEALGRISQAGQTTGTPGYMAPEQARGERVGSKADLYSTGVVLFELLAGQLPHPIASSGGMASLVPRRGPPDPRDILPEREVHEDLAQVCMRALALDPELRFPTAVAFKDALRGAMASQRMDDTRGLGSGASRRDARRALEATQSLDTATGRSLSGSTPPVSVIGTRESRRAVIAPMLGREGDMAWADALLRGRPTTPVVAFWGAPGVGRTRLLQEVSAAAMRSGALVVPVMLAPAPWDEIGYLGLRQMILQALGTSDGEALLDRAGPTTDRSTWKGLEAIFSRPVYAPGAVGTREAVAEALAWALAEAVKRSDRGRFVLAIDDIDRLDGASAHALRDVLRGPRIEGFSLLCTSERARDLLGPRDDEHERRLRGLSRAEANEMLAGGRAEIALPRSDDDIEPLYVEQLLRETLPQAGAIAGTLLGLAEQRICALTPAERRALQAIAVAGADHKVAVAALLRDPLELDLALPRLLAKGFVAAYDDEVAIAHPVFARTALALAPTGAIAEIHDAAASRLEAARDLMELRSFHAIRGQPDFEAFMLVEEAARQRILRGDGEGAIAALSQALGAARVQLLRGEIDTAGPALNVFGRKLATLLAAHARLDDARGVLEEILSTTDPGDVSRSLVLEQLAAVALASGKAEESERRHREALDVAERSGDERLIGRLRSRTRAKVSLSSRPSGEMPSVRRPDNSLEHQPSAPTEGARAAVLVVEDDADTREALLMMVEMGGYRVFGAEHGRDALEVLTRIPRPGIILMDLRMPVMSGWELLESLRADAELASIPVVVMSANANKRELGATRVMRKPVEVRAILDVIREYCG